MNESFQAGHEERLRRGKPPLETSKLPEKKEEEFDMAVYQGHGPETYRDRVEAVHGPEFARSFETVLNVAQEMKNAGGRALLVGGCVRDEVLGEASNDFDLEIYGLQPNEVERIAKRFGKVDAVGKAFGVLLLTNEDSVKIDIALPRTDSQKSDKHNDVVVTLDPNMSLFEASKRRDFTINSMMKDPLTGEIFDPQDGVKDLKDRILRVTDHERFGDDGLRVLRGAQFIARFGLRLDEASADTIRETIPKIEALPKDRLIKEWDKLMEAPHTTLGMMFMKDLGIIERYYPQLHELEGVYQEVEWHPERDVWIHTLMTLEAAQQLARFYRMDKEQTRLLKYTVLCHDLGKPSTTRLHEGRLQSPGHEPAGEAPTRTFLESIGMTRIQGGDQQIEKIVKLVREHLWPVQSYARQMQFEALQRKGGVLSPNQRAVEPVSDGAFRKLANRLGPATVQELARVSEVDVLGRGPFADPNHADQLLLPTPSAASEWLIKRSNEVGVFQEKPVPTVTGKELINLGFHEKRGGDLRIGFVMHFADFLRDDRNYTKEEVLALIVQSITSSDGKPNLDKTLEILREEVGEEEWNRWETEQEQIAQERLQRKAEKLKEQQEQREAKKQKG